MDEDKPQPNLAQAQIDLARLCRQVVRLNKRVEIATQDGDAVLISKSELETLEHALEIYANTEEAQRLHDRVAELCGMASDQSVEMSRTPVAS